MWIFEKNEQTHRHHRSHVNIGKSRCDGVCLSKMCLCLVNTQRRACVVMTCIIHGECEISFDASAHFAHTFLSAHLHILQLNDTWVIHVIISRIAHKFLLIAWVHMCKEVFSAALIQPCVCANCEHIMPLKVYGVWQKAKVRDACISHNFPFRALTKRLPSAKRKTSTNY